MRAHILLRAIPRGIILTQHPKVPKGNRTPITCLEGRSPNHWTTDTKKRSKLYWERSNTSGTLKRMCATYYTNSQYLCNSDYKFSSLLAFSRLIMLSIYKSFSSFELTQNWTGNPNLKRIVLWPIELWALILVFIDFYMIVAQPIEKPTHF